MGPVTAQLIDALGYDPDDGVPEVLEIGDLGSLRELAVGAVIAARNDVQPGVAHRE